MDSSLSAGSLANWSQVLLAIKTVHSNQSRCRTGVRLATSTDTYSTKVFINDKKYLLMGRTISCCIWGLLSIILLFVYCSYLYPRA